MTLYRPTHSLVCGLPMTMAEHDTTNNRTLDASGSGQHFTFGNGSTESTYPWKIPNRKGYKITDSTQRFYLTSPTYSTSALTVFCALFIDGSRYGSTGTVASHRDASNLGFHLDFGATTFRWFTGGSAAANRADFTHSKAYFDRLISLTGVYDGATKLFIDGQYRAAAATPLAPANPATITEPAFIGRYYAGTLLLTTATIFSFRIYNRALSPLEIQSMHYEVRRKLHTV